MFLSDVFLSFTALASKLAVCQCSVTKHLSISFDINTHKQRKWLIKGTHKSSSYISVSINQFDLSHVRGALVDIDRFDAEELDIQENCEMPSGSV